MNDISTTLTEADTLVEFQINKSSKPKKEDKPQHRQCRGVKGDKPPQHDVKEKSPQKKDGSKDGKKEVKCKHNCFICDDDHWVNDYLKKKTFNATKRSNQKCHQPKMLIWVASNSSMY